jgi:DNA repair protein RecN (Recombination protein N)
MLTNLHIQNYALIDSAEIELGPGLTIITGETGAGKSILLGALGLLLGDRADSGLLFDKSRKCVVEGKFTVGKFGLKKFFDENDLDYSDETIIRREVTSEGKSRAFVNDTPVTISFLKQIAPRLLDVHSQHETLTLANSSFQLSALDAVAGNSKLNSEYAERYKRYRKSLSALEDLKELEAKSKKDLDYFTFQFEELDSLQLKEMEQDELESELKTLENAETIKGGLASSYSALNGGDENLVSGINAVKNSMNQLSKFNPKVAALAERLNSALIELQDIAAETEQLEEEIVYDPNRIQLVNERLDAIYRLQQKHGVRTVTELIVLCEDLRAKIDAISSLDSQLLFAEKEMNEALEQVRETGGKLTAKREESAPKLSKEIKSMLSELGMPAAQLKVELEKTTEPLNTGFDKVQFLFTANKGAELQPIAKVASGGELSRLMLSLKAMLSKGASLPTIIFDEIDTGISGDIAAKAGAIMHKMGANMQVITITHLPQVASKGDTHLFVYKEETGKKTVSRIKQLTDKQRIEEIAKMLSAGKPGEAARENAKELLSN